MIITGRPNLAPSRVARPTQLQLVLESSQTPLWQDSECYTVLAIAYSRSTRRSSSA